MTLQTEVTEKPYVKLTDAEIAELFEAAPASALPAEAKLAKHLADDAGAKKVQGLAP